jgi:hypothetical protein
MTMDAIHFSRSRYQCVEQQAAANERQIKRIIERRNAVSYRGEDLALNLLEKVIVRYLEFETQDRPAITIRSMHNKEEE